MAPSTPGASAFAAWLPMSSESHCEKLRAFTALFWILTRPR